MSLAELKSELQKLTPAELEEIGATVQGLLGPQGAVGQFAKPSDSFGCGRGLMILKPGWDEDEPLEMWEALRDDTSA